MGLIGFSQGTKVVAGLLHAVEVRRELGLVKEQDWCDFAFGIMVCPSYPPPLFPPSIKQLVLSSSDLSPEEKKSMLEGDAARIRSVPSFSVLGRQDEWNWAGKGMLEQHFEVGEQGKAEVMEWDMGHHYPVATEESEKMMEWMVKRAGREDVVVR